jgi:hypothetical protein
MKLKIVKFLHMLETKTFILYLSFAPFECLMSTCFFQETLYFLVASQLFRLFYVFKHHDLQIQIKNVVPNTFWNVIPFHTTTSILDMICHFLVRHTCVNIESHAINQWNPMFVSPLGTSVTSWQISAFDQQEYWSLIPSHFLLS